MVRRSSTGRTIVGKMKGISDKFVCYNGSAPELTAVILFESPWFIMQKDRERFLLFKIYRFRDALAFREIYDAYYDRILRHLSYKLPTKEDADEQAAEVFLRLWNYLQEARVENLAALIYRIAHGVYANFYRRAASRPKEDELAEGMEFVDEAPGPEEQTTIQMSVDTMKGVLPKLKEDYRDVVIMRYLDELTVREISLALEKSENTVRVTLHRALKTVRRLIDEENPNSNVC